MIEVNDRKEYLQKCGDFICSPNPMCIEIGCYRGEFTMLIVDIIQPKMIFAIDPYVTDKTKTYSDGLPTAYSTNDDMDIFKRLFYNELDRKVIVCKNYSYFVSGWMPEKYFDFIYHDASHLYDDLKKDLIEWLPKLTSDGLMCGHDYGAGAFPGVKQAVDEFCKEHNFEMIIFNTNGGDYALRAIQ